MTEPSLQVGAMGSVLTATFSSSAQRLVRLDVRDERIELELRPAEADGGHEPLVLRQVLSVAKEVAQPVRIRQRAVACDWRPDVALSLEPVAFRARRLPRGAADSTPL